MANQIQTALSVLRRKQVEETVALSRSQLYALMQKGQFPKPIRLGARAVGWLKSEIQLWLADRVKARRSAS